MNTSENPSTNPATSLCNPGSPNSGVDELDPLALGALEEVNTSSTYNDGRNNIHSSKNNVNVETFVPEVLGLQKKSPLNSPYMYSEHSKMATEISINDPEGRLKPGIHDFTDSENVGGKANENGTSDNVSDSEGSGVTTTVVSEGLSLENTRGIVVVEEVALEQINELIANSAAQLQDYSSSNDLGVVSHSDRQDLTSKSQNSQTCRSSGENFESRQSLQAAESFEEESPELFRKRFEDLDTKEIAEALTNELKKYSIPQSVFARKVLNRSQGTLSDVLRKPKPWSELRGGREIFRKMKEWLDLPEVKRIPQLRAEAALELDAKARREDPGGPVTKKARLNFTDSQKRALFAIFKETKKPSKEMQNALAEELGLERGTVANFFMNARRRHPDL